MGSSVNVTEFVQQRQILGNAVRKRQKHVESFLEEKGLTSLINKVGYIPFKPILVGKHSKG